jgi:phosphoenolpyruvate synthase/pyruvate phosphate dikinase
MATLGILWFDQITLADLPRVGGINASLGEMAGSLTSQGVVLAPGFATNAQMFRDYIADNQLQAAITQQLDDYSNEQQSLALEQVALSVGLQQMAQSEASGVMFSLDTATGFPDVALINGAWRLGETVVQGSVTPDRFMVYKPLLEKPGLRPLIEKQCGRLLR